jgi:hypothetical protein
MEPAILPCVISIPSVAWRSSRKFIHQFFTVSNFSRPLIVIIIASRPSRYITLKDDIYKHNVDG